MNWVQEMSKGDLDGLGLKKKQHQKKMEIILEVPDDLISQLESPPQSVDEKVVDVDDVTTDDNIIEIESDIWIDIPDDLSSDDEAAPGQIDAINQHNMDAPIGFTRLCQEIRVDAG